jgi:hypothetical protein
MHKLRRLVMICTALSTLVACSLPNPCPDGAVRQHNRCVPTKDAGTYVETSTERADASKPEGNAAPQNRPLDDAGSSEGTDVPIGETDAAEVEDASQPLVEMDAASEPTPDSNVAVTVDAWLTIEPADSGFDTSTTEDAAALDVLEAGQDTGPDAGDGCVAPDSSAWRSLQASPLGDPDASSCAPSAPACSVNVCAAGACSDGGANATACNACVADGTGLWPNNKVPICWTLATLSRVDVNAIAIQLWDRLNTSWPAVADVEFQFIDWNPCPADVLGVVPIDALADQRAVVHAIGYQGVNAAYAPVEVGTLRGDFNAGLIPHLAGHLLGFDHEPARPQSASDSFGNCAEVSDAGVPDVSGTFDRESVMLGTSDCSSHPVLSRWDIVNARKKYGMRADNVISTGAALYARKRSTGDIYVLDGASWSKVSGPVGQLAAVGSTLYGLTPDLSAIMEYSASGTRWRRIGDEALDIMACGTALCATLPSGDFVRYRAGTWERLGGPAIKHVANASAIYRLTFDRHAVEVYSGAGTVWNHVGSDAGTIYATNSMLLATDPSSGNLLLYSGDSAAWSPIGVAGRLFLGAGNGLYALTPDFLRVYRYVGPGDNWAQVGSTPDWLYGGPDTLYMVEQGSKDILRYNGQVWERLGQP